MTRTRPEFNSLSVADIRRETDDATSVAFAVPKNLAEAYHFTQGQYLTLRAEVNGEDLRRPYSVCVSPEEKELRVCVKKLPGGRFSTFVNEKLSIGDQIDVLPPMGRFFVPVDEGSKRRYLGIAGGSGITPVISILKTVLAREPGAEFTLLYGNRDRGSIIFRDQLADLKDRYMGRLRLFHILSDELPEMPIYGGIMDQAKVSHLVSELIDPDTIDQVFICGPGPMMDGAQAALDAIGVAAEKIKVESFGNRPVAQASAAPAPNKPALDVPSAKVEIMLNGDRTEISVPMQGRAVLDAALDAKLDLPYACKGGVCCTCKAKLLEGKVSMDINYGLEPEEIKAGYILTCQSHPLTEKLVIDYDV
jgi:ring-1,2-phenylacetyl-CoA epoxidase subunit PaaE